AENELLVHNPIAVDLQQQNGAISAGTFSRALDVLADTQHLMLRAVEFPLHDPAAKVEFLKIFTRVFGFNGSEGSRTREYREWSADRPLDSCDHLPFRCRRISIIGIREWGDAAECFNHERFQRCLCKSSVAFGVLATRRSERMPDIRNVVRRSAFGSSVICENDTGCRKGATVFTPQHLL